MLDRTLARIPVIELGRALAQQHEILFRKRRGWSGLPTDATDGIVMRVVLDVARAWSDARLAFAIGDSENEGSTQIVLSLVGERALRQADPAGAVRHLLAEHGGSRSFLE